MSMIMFDIDFFKEVNDTYGHVVGDQVLRGVADIIRKRVRTSDMVSRYGGEEFVVLLTNTDRENARKVAEEIRENMEKISFKTKEGEKIKITLSGGVTDYRKGEEMDDFFIRLDQNLYHAKRNGRNRIISDGQEKE
jgi:diguanylate cyclase (GGDEF)-like protein